MRKKALCLIAVLAGIFVLGPVSDGMAQQRIFENAELRTAEGPAFAPAEIVVRFKRGVSDDVIRRINRQHDTSVLSISKRGQFRRLRLPRNKTVEEMVQIYRKNPNVEYAEPNFIASALYYPNDQYYRYQWHLHSSPGGINMEYAWDKQKGSPGVIVAVLDTGVAYENYGNYALAPDLAQTNFVPGYDFVNNDFHPNDDHGHGTHVAGTIAQSTNNSIGVAGVAFNTSLMPVKVLSSTGSGTHTAIADGIYFAADKGAEVINMSLGGTSGSTTLENALAYAYNKGVAIVCAAGNEYQKGNPPVYPAAYDAYCIAVGATQFDETRAPYSNTGSYLDLTAPGGNLNADQNKDGYGDGVLQQTFAKNKPKNFGYYFYQGTSMAAPHVSGVAALLIADGISGPDNVRRALQETAKDKGPDGWDEEYGWGIVDAYDALNYAFVVEKIHDVAVTGIDAPDACIAGDTVSIVVSTANPGDFDETFDVALSYSADLDQFSPIGVSQNVSLPAKGTAELTFAWDTSTNSPDKYTLLAEASQVDGETNTANNTLSTDITVKEAVHDVAVTAINAPLEAYQNDTIKIEITVENLGTYAETTTVRIDDETEIVPIGEKTVSLSAGASIIISFDWDTSGAFIGGHKLIAQASAVEGETNTGNNSAEITVTIKEKSSAVLHVADIEMSLRTRTAGRNRFTTAMAEITIADAAGSPVPGANVSGSWSGATSDTDSGTTGTTGKVTVASDEVKNAPKGTTFTFTVNNATKSGWDYDPYANKETSNSVTVE